MADCWPDDPELFPGNAAADLCNGVDDDCDDDVDEDFEVAECDTGDAGVCAPGELACVNGVEICDALAQRGDEVCDGLDNDCDGLADEDDGQGECAAHESCWHILQAGAADGDGIYSIDTDGEGPAEPFDAYCDMTRDDGGWTLIVLTNGNIAGHADASYADALSHPGTVNGDLTEDLDDYDLFMGTRHWNAAGSQGQMLFRVGPDGGRIQDVVLSGFEVYGDGTRIRWSDFGALAGGIPNIAYNTDGHLQALDAGANGNNCASGGGGLWGPWFYNGCSNVSPWCTGHGDCDGQPVRMQWRNQSNFQTATAGRCSNHGEIYVR